MAKHINKEKVTSVLFTMYLFYQLPFTLSFPHTCHKDTCQEDNTMMESEVVTGLSGGEKVNGVLPVGALMLYQVCRMSTGQNKHRCLLQQRCLEHINKHAWTGPSHNCFFFHSWPWWRVKNQRSLKIYHDTIVVGSSFYHHKHPHKCTHQHTTHQFY